MIFNMDEYCEFLDSIMKRIHLCKTHQLIKAFKNCYKDMNDSFAAEIIFALQRQGHVLLSEDGWAITKSMYQRITNDKFFENLRIHKTFRLESLDYEIKKYGFDEDLLDCFTIAIDMMPNSLGFTIGENPWEIIFDTQGGESKESKLYQITKISDSNEIARIEFLKSLPKIADDSIKNVVQRIAIIDNPKHAFLVPHIGFTYIVKLDSRYTRGYTIVEKRTGDDIWRDC